MKRFELPEMNISMFDAESVTMLSATKQAQDYLDNAITGEGSVVVTQWSDWTVTP
jgi:hypothetical protein